MTTDLTTLTASELTSAYNDLTGKNVKPGSYSKAKLIEMIQANPKDEGFEGFTHCPHCGVHHSNGFCTNDDILEQGGEHNKTHKIVCLSCLGEFGEELETTFTLREAAQSIGVSAKVARSRYRNLFNDHQRTFYVFPRSRWNEVIMIISPKRKGQ